MRILVEIQCIDYYDKQAARCCTFNCILFLISKCICVLDINMSNRYQDPQFR